MAPPIDKTSQRQPISLKISKHAIEFTWVKVMILSKQEAALLLEISYILFEKIIEIFLFKTEFCFKTESF